MIIQCRKDARLAPAVPDFGGCVPGHAGPCRARAWQGWHAERVNAPFSHVIRCLHETIRARHALHCPIHGLRCRLPRSSDVGGSVHRSHDHDQCHCPHAHQECGRSDVRNMPDLPSSFSMGTRPAGAIVDAAVGIVDGDGRPAALDPPIRRGFGCAVTDRRQTHRPAGCRRENCAPDAVRK